MSKRNKRPKEIIGIGILVLCIGALILIFSVPEEELPPLESEIQYLEGIWANAKEFNDSTVQLRIEGQEGGFAWTVESFNRTNSSSRWGNYIFCSYIVSNNDTDYYILFGEPIDLTKCSCSNETYSYKYTFVGNDFQDFNITSVILFETSGLFDYYFRVG